MGDAVKLDVDAWERDFRINVTSMMLMSRHVIPEMRKNGRGAIVNMSSVSGCKSKLCISFHSFRQLMSMDASR
jgi:NAD(P)-dependent dehydrogenase (short-subunit alcohol dehydrogenase family)